MVELDPRLGGASVPTPDVFVAAADGTRLGTVSNYAAEEKVLAMLREVIAGEERLSAESEQEAGWSAPRRGWLRYCIGDVDGARALLEEPDGAEEALMRARIERWEGDLDAARAALRSAELDRGDRSAEVGRIELAAGNLEASLAAFEAVAQDHPARSEVDYRRGVVLFRLGHVEAAKAVWLRAVERFGENRWSYRADWALAGADEKPGKGRASFSTMGEKTALGRHGYMGRRNPDLEG